MAHRLPNHRLPAEQQPASGGSQGPGGLKSQQPGKNQERQLERLSQYEVPKGTDQSEIAGEKDENIVGSLTATESLIGR